MRPRRRSVVAREACALIVLILSAASLAAESPEKPLIAVLPFQHFEASAAAARLATALMEKALVSSQAYTVVSPADRDRVLQAQEPGLAECAEVECAVRIGRLLQASRVVVGNVVGLGRKLILNAKIIDIDTTEVLAADTTSAAGAGGLEEACRRLALFLVEGARPGAIAETAEPVPEVAERAPGAAEPSPEAAPPIPSEPEKAIPRIQPKEEKPAEKARPSKAKPSRPPASGAVARDPRAFWLSMSGLLVLELGNIASPMSFELLLQSDESYQRYADASTGFDALYQEYQRERAGYLALAITSYAGWSLGTSAVLTSLFLFPNETYGLSPWGRAVFASGLSLTLAANVLGLLAGNQSLINIELYNRYLSATANADSLFAEYRSGYVLYSVSRILSYSFWALGGAAMVGAFFLPGERAPTISGPLDRWLVAAGTALMAGGSLAQSTALHGRRLAEQNYVVSSVLAYSFWALGGAGILTALFLTPTAAGEKRESPRPVTMVLPTPDGLAFLVSLDLEAQ